MWTGMKIAVFFFLATFFLNYVDFAVSQRVVPPEGSGIKKNFEID